MNVPLFAVGDGTDAFVDGGTVDNTDIAKFVAAIFGDNSFGE